MSAPGNQMTYYGMITDKASYEDFKHFCKMIASRCRASSASCSRCKDPTRGRRARSAAAFPGSRHSLASPTANKRRRR